MFYTTISLINYVFMCLFVVAITIAIAFAVLVMVSKAESIVLHKSYCIMYTCQNKYFIHSFIHQINEYYVPMTACLSVFMPGLL